MGLVIQTALADSLLYPLAGRKTEEATSGEQGDGFAKLLASLSGEAPAGSTATGATALLISLAEGEAKPADANADIPAVMAAMQLLAQLNLALPGPVNGGQNTAEAAVAAAPAVTGGTDAPLLKALVADEASIPDAAPTEASTDATMVAGAATQPSETPSVEALAVPPSEGAATPAQAIASAIAAAGVEVAGKATVKEHTKADTPKPKDEAPLGAPGALASNPENVSVVRSAGNAEQKAQDDGQGNPDGGDGKASAKPNASIQGIAHAAAGSAAGELRPADPTVADLSKPAPAQVVVPEAVEHVGRTIIERVEQGGGEARLTLRPEALGEVVLHIHTDGDRVRVEIHAERAEAANLLRDHTQDLSQLLGQRGLNLTDVYVGLGGQGSNNQQDGLPAWAQRREQADGSFASLLGIEEPGAADRSNRLRSAYNPDGAMSYRV